MEPTKKVRDAIDGLSEAELQYEIQRGKDSRFSRAIPYMQKRLDELEDGKDTQEQRENPATKQKDRLIQIAIGVVMVLAALISFCSRLT